MANLREIHRYMNGRLTVVLDDGRVGKIMRVDTHFPLRSTTVSVWTDDADGAEVKVDLSRIVGTVEQEPTG